MLTLAYYNSTTLYKITINGTNTVTSSISASPASYRLASWSKPSPQQVISEHPDFGVPTHICFQYGVLLYCSLLGRKTSSLLVLCWSIKAIFDCILDTMLCEMFSMSNVIQLSTRQRSSQTCNQHTCISSLISSRLHC